MILNQDLIGVSFRVSATGKTIRIVDDATMVNMTGPTLVFDPDAVVGLDDIPQIRRDKTSRPTSHGSYGETGYVDPRVITLTGIAIAPDYAQLHELRDTLAMALNTGEMLEYTFSTRAGQRFVSGYLDSGLEWVQMYDTSAKWKFDIYCPDPRMYGQPASSPRTATFGIIDDTAEGISYPIVYDLSYNVGNKLVESSLTNQGNAPAYPVFSFNGKTLGFTITASIASTKENIGNLTFSGATSSTEQVRIDTARGRLSIGGSDRSMMLDKRDWIILPPKTTVNPKLTIKIATSNTVVGDKFLVTATFRDTYI